MSWMPVCRRASSRHPRGPQPEVLRHAHRFLLRLHITHGASPELSPARPAAGAPLTLAEAGRKGYSMVRGAPPVNVRSCKQGSAATPPFDKRAAQACFRESKLIAAGAPRRQVGRAARHSHVFLTCDRQDLADIRWHSHLRHVNCSAVRGSLARYENIGYAGAPKGGEEN